VTYIDKTGKVVPLFESTRAARNTEVQESPVLLTNEDFSFLKALTLPRRFFDPYSVGFTQARRVKSKESNVLAPFVIKQKRVKDNNPIPLKIKSHECDPLVAAKLGLVPIQPTLFASGALRSLDIYTSAAYRLTAKGKSRDELMSVQLSRRLLRTQRTLMLPSHTNLTIVTNSYDVVHSWFLPSLGLKMDCVPGRSTHHTFYVDSLGFFYGQCAEICGRYHHHMPIRICMLPFEHFFV
jgi:heme/copper-type cytochrome/quinol oxidase subunit 2